MSWRTPTWSWTPPSACFGQFEWVEERDGRVPSRAVRGGIDKDGGEIFIGRAWESNDLLPAKVCPSHRCAFVSFGGNQVEKDHYQVLISDHVAWKPARGGNVPPEAIRVGHTVDGEPLYVGRVLHEGTLTPGKVHPSHECLYIAWAGNEIKYHDYEIMVLN
ncbi:DM9 [Nesidiocoris tenuis]|uniref:DM9 n=1 Tax=Nesidiocoris tenuis TaxID=355587 RepID=A0ABN7AW22_9HEMI|nr:DM9 [Nesidiocoris tenuis]